MRKSTSTLTPAQVYRFAIDFCQPHLQFRAVGKVTGEVILSVLFAAAARMSSIHATCRRLDKAPCEETFTAALYPQLHDLNALKRRINAAFADHLPRALRRRRKRPLALAIDRHFLNDDVRRGLSVDNFRRDVCNRGRDPLIGFNGASLHALDPATHRQRFRGPLRSIR